MFELVDGTFDKLVGSCRVGAVPVTVGMAVNVNEIVGRGVVELAK